MNPIHVIKTGDGIIAAVIQGELSESIVDIFEAFKDKIFAGIPAITPTNASEIQKKRYLALEEYANSLGLTIKGVKYPFTVLFITYLLKTYPYLRRIPNISLDTEELG